MTPETELLLDAAEDGEREAARELAALVRQAIQRPDQRVGAAFRPKRRGGEPEWLAWRRAERNSGYRDLAFADYGTTSLTPTQANTLARRVKRALSDARLAERSGDSRADAVRRIRTSGLDPISGRQLLRVLPKSTGQKKL
jgi:hypothetical protein